MHGLLLLSLVTMTAQPHRNHPHASPPAETHGDHHGNPHDMQEYLQRLEGPERAEWQKPDEVVTALKLTPGQRACDIGAGPGYFSLRLAKAVGPTGRVFAVDVEPRMLEVLGQRMASSGTRNVTPVMGLGDDPLLPPGSCDVILIVNAYHHFPDGPAYLQKLGVALAPGGRVVNIDFHKRELPMGPPAEMKVSREDFLKHAQAAGLTLAEEPAFLPYQYFLVLKAKR